MEMRDDDAFWAARRVTAFTDEMIRAIVHTGEYRDPAAERHLADVLIKRRDKIAQAYLTDINPIVAPRLDADPVLTFENAAFAAGMPEEPVRYRAAWYLFDNNTGDTRWLSETQSHTATVDAPDDLPTTVNRFVMVDIAADSEFRPAWRRPVRAYFRRETD